MVCTAPQKGWFQATFWFSPFPGRHARPERGEYAAPDSLSCSPPRLLDRVGSARQSASRDHHTRSLRFATAFHSPPWLCSFERLREGSPLPACCFSPTPNRAFRPVRFATPGLAPLLHCLRGADPRSVPVAGRRFGIPWPFFSLHSPLGTASLSFNVPADTCPGGSPSPSTRSPFAPRYQLRFTFASFGSSFPVRCRLRGLLFLLTSWNLLNNAPETRRSQ